MVYHKKQHCSYSFPTVAYQILTPSPNPVACDQQPCVISFLIQSVSDQQPCVISFLIQSVKVIAGASGLSSAHATALHREMLLLVKQDLAYRLQGRQEAHLLYSVL